MKFVEEARLKLEPIEEIGQEGKNSSVQRGRDPQLDAEVAIKRMPAASFRDVDLYYEEAQKLYAVAHPNVVQVMYGCRTDKDILLVMPYYSRGSVSALMKKRFLTPREVVRYGLDFLTGLHHVHVEGLIHTDIKPNNVLLDASDRALLTDFGHARKLDESGLASLKGFYWEHIAPEQVTTTEFSQKLDIYRAGFTLYRMANRDMYLKRDYKRLMQQGGETFYRALRDGKYPDRRKFLPHIPSRLRRVIRKALQPDPEDRYDTVLDMMNALGTVETGLDWQLSIEGEKWIWESPFDGHVKRIEMVTRNGVCDVEATVTYDSGHSHSKPDACDEGLTDKDAGKLIRDFIRTNS